jgi:hypothetical protein
VHADPGIDGQADRAQLGAGVGVRQAAADRAAIADGGVRDQRQRLGHDGAALPDQGGALQRALPGHRPDGQPAVGPGLDVVEVAERVEVHQQLGTSQPQVHQRDQALPARQHLAVVSGLAQRGHGVVNIDGPVILERSWLHRLLPAGSVVVVVAAAAAAVTLSKISCGVTGTSVIRTPSGVTASSIALAIAAGAVM